MTNTRSVIILLGKSGSGKGTQAELLKDKFGFSEIVSGDLLRTRAKKDDYTGKKLSEELARGKLVPTAVIFKLWLDRAERLKNTRDFNGLIMDGNPRKIKEAYLLDEAFKWYGWDGNVKIFYIDISDKEAFERLGKRRICTNKKCGKIIPFTEENKDIKKCPKCGRRLYARNDDADPKAIKERLRWFKAEVGPIISYYKKAGRLTTINGEQTITDVYKDILKALD